MVAVLSNHIFWYSSWIYISVLVMVFKISYITTLVFHNYLKTFPGYFSNFSNQIFLILSLSAPIRPESQHNEPESVSNLSS